AVLGAALFGAATSPAALAPALAGAVVAGALPAGGAAAAVAAAAGSFSGPLPAIGGSLFSSTQRTRAKRVARWKLPWPRIGDQATPELSCMAYRFMRQASPGAGGAALALSNDDHGMRASTT